MAQGAYNDDNCKISKLVPPLKILCLRQIMRVSGGLCFFYFVEFLLNFYDFLCCPVCSLEIFTSQILPWLKD